MSAEHPSYLAAVKLLKNPQVIEKLRACKYASDAFIIGYCLAQVCHNCGDLFNPPKGKSK